ncbi:extracellular solute-binding protein [Plastoroseomonas hellenica]|uniref:Extracellular solute-binding protein n=1 Tax=Plastoroseomonas hellenica TaxID=2687306 RepID=A0ABS5ESR3_9PROT|nr:extracellular solute-binding protein [Plastoroseomonas hellenica]MBR0647090.1 extracellular solute-binding protein [Plastoroseomonas hellenica]MBR0663336.1 extracellular solute-binding protein [Plastoroseomonas hellenica]
MMPRTRRGLLGAASAIAIGGVVRAPWAQDLPAHEQPLYEAAKREGEVTWYTGQLQAEPSEAAGRAFSERYPGVRVNVVRTTSQVAFQRLSQDLRARAAQCDVFSSTDVSHLTYLKREGLLMPYRPENAAGMVRAARDAADADGHYQVTYLALYMMGRRSDRVTEAEAPRRWQDLVDPRWRDKLAVGHPGYSGAIGGWALLMHKMYGEAYFRALERNRPQIGRSAGDPVTTLNAGERVVGIGVPSATSLLSISRGNPLTLIYPEEGTVMLPAPSGAIRAAPHPNAAKLFMEFMCGDGYSQALRPFFAESLRPGVPPPEGSRPLDSITVITPSAAELEQRLPEIKELWRDIFRV